MMAKNSFLYILLFVGHVAPTKYYCFNLSKVSWYTAFQECRSRNLQLASIHSREDQAAIENVMYEADLAPIWYWISGINLGDTGNYVWMGTGKPMKYTYWATGQPNGGSEHCLMIRLTRSGNTNSTHWVDWTCTEKSEFICEDRNNDEESKNNIQPINITVICQ